MADKFEKRDKCLYCDNPMEAKYRNKRFCSDKCRTYWNREKLGGVIKKAEEKAFLETHDAIMEMAKGGTTTTKGLMPTSDNSERISELEKELSNIPDKTKGLGKKLAQSLNSRIYKLKYNQ